jgi:hypothetical protein
MIDSKKQLEHGSEIAGQRADVVNIVNASSTNKNKFILRKQLHKMMLIVDVNVKKFKKTLINFVKQFNHLQKGLDPKKKVLIKYKIFVYL